MLVLIYTHSIFAHILAHVFFPRRIDNPGQLNTPQALVRNLQQYLHIEKRGNNIVVTDGNGFKFYLVLKRLRKHIPLLQIVDIIDI